MSVYVKEYERRVLKRQAIGIIIMLVVFGGFIVFLNSLNTADSEFINLNTMTDMTDTKGEYFTMSINTLSDYYAEDTDGSAYYSLTFVGDKMVTVKIPSYESRKAEQLIEYMGEEIPEHLIMNKNGRVLGLESELKEFAKEFIAYNMDAEITDQQLEEILWPYMLDIDAPIPTEGQERAMVITFSIGLILFLIVMVLGTLINYKKFRKQVEKYVTTAKDAEDFDREMAEEPLLNYKDRIKITKNWVILGGKWAIYQTAIKIEEIVCIYPQATRVRSGLVRVTNHMLVLRTADKKYHRVQVHKREALDNLSANVQSKIPWAWKENYDKKMGMTFEELVRTINDARRAYEAQTTPEETSHEV